MAVLTAAALTMASLSGCQSADKEETAADQTETETETAAGSITVTDQSGRTDCVFLLYFYGASDCIRL